MESSASLNYANVNYDKNIQKSGISPFTGPFININKT